MPAGSPVSKEGATMNTMYRVHVLMPVKVEVEMVASRQARERRDQMQAHQAITPENTVDWRSYDHHAVPPRWRVR